eukprot:gnl/MRDRNA2_/MRDRNA2_236381_c0_seq1.p1 gnl/MRDRNA2_/MRDRNA2_236381_c0~~gnl/MRDRNA2_/MRDRNA2_236381_c0_seq1.p1  ORF type:complete len:150 (+),score=30.98 gnl/MRDRNA2_/MRDRNA2_236381_c0_seq1:62-451(+)
MVSPAGRVLLQYHLDRHGWQKPTPPPKDTVPPFNDQTGGQKPSMPSHGWQKPMPLPKDPVPPCSHKTAGQEPSWPSAAKWIAFLFLALCAAGVALVLVMVIRKTHDQQGRAAQDSVEMVEVSVPGGAEA